MVPYWRVSDDAWNLGEDSYLTGIGVLRNYGGDVIVIPWEEDRHQELLRLLRADSGVDLQRVTVVIDDRTEAWQVIAEELAPITVLPWSRRDELIQRILKDKP